MPFNEIDAIKEAQELQEIFKDDPEAVKEFKEFELAHIEAKRLEQEEVEFRQLLAETRKRKNITQTEIKEKTGLTQQVISRIETQHEISPSLKNLFKYVDAIGYEITIQPKHDQTHHQRVD